MGKIRTFLRLPLARKLMLAEALMLSGYYRFKMLCMPFPALAKGLGMPEKESPWEENCGAKARQVGWAVGAVCRRTPWQSQCLVQALTARKMLQRRGISCTMYMGARRNDQGQAEAHAWLRSGKTFVVGGDGSRSYAITSVYCTER